MSLAPSTVQHESQPTSLTPLIHPRPFADWRLPIPLTSLVGRDHECARISALLGRPDVRLLTLSGPAGVGKTRLALSALADLDVDFPDGTWFVPLAAITDPTLFPAAIAQVLGVRETSGRSFADGLKARLRNAAALLLLDNLEQVLGAAPLIVDLLIACPALKVVVTSRATLHVAGEHDFAVQPLPLPDLSCSPSLEALAISPA
ncbi:MAG: ATP-binding protein, partial [Dehalococcoidia bacterium]